MSYAMLKLRDFGDLIESCFPVAGPDDPDLLAEICHLTVLLRDQVVAARRKQLETQRS